MKKLVMGTIFFLVALFSFGMSYMILTPLQYNFSTVGNATIYASNPTAQTLTTWNRINAGFGFGWSAWGIAGVLFLVLWLVNYVWGDDYYGQYAAPGPGGPR